MGELGALFNPGMRHELEERQAKAARREEEGNARDGDLRIDLESGVAVINIAGADEEDPGAAADPAAAAAGSDDTTGASAIPADAATPATQPDASPTAEPASPTAEPATPVLRPRGKRGLSATHR